MLNDASTAIDERADELKQQGQKPLASGIAKTKELEEIALEAAQIACRRSLQRLHLNGRHQWQLPDPYM